MKKVIKAVSMINDRYKLGLILYIFTFLFAPPLIKDVNFVFVNFLFACVMIITKYRKDLINLLKKNVVKKVILLMFSYVLYYIISIVVNRVTSGDWYFSNYVINFYSIFLNFVVVFVCGLYVVFRSYELNLGLNELLTLFIIAGVIQLIIALVTLLVPSVKTFLVRIMFLNTGDILLNTPWIVARRFYGFANNMLDLFGFGTGIIASLPLFLSGNSSSNFKRVLLVPFLLIVPLLNSRSGIIITAIGFFVFCISLFFKDVDDRKIRKGKKKKKGPLSYVIASFMIILLVCGVVFLVFKFSPNTIDWIKKDLISFIPGMSNSDGKEHTADALFGEEFWTLPDKFVNVLFGTGINVSAYSDYSVDDKISSDVGYINEIWKVGIVGSLLLYYFMYYLLKQGFVRVVSIKHKMLYIFFGLAIAVFLIKASAFTYNTATAIIYTCCMFPVYKSMKDKMKKGGNEYYE